MRGSERERRRERSRRDCESEKVCNIKFRHAQRSHERGGVGGKFRVFRLECTASSSGEVRGGGERRELQRQTFHKRVCVRARERERDERANERERERERERARERQSDKGMR